MTISDFNGDLPGNINRIINEKGMKKKAVAQRAGFSGQYLSDMLTNRRIIKVSDVAAVSSALGVPIAELYEKKPPHRARA